MKACKSLRPRIKTKVDPWLSPGLHETFAKLYPMILDRSPLPDSLSDPVILPADLPSPSSINFDLRPRCGSRMYKDRHGY